MICLPCLRCKLFKTTQIISLPSFLFTCFKTVLAQVVEKVEELEKAKIKPNCVFLNRHLLSRTTSVQRKVMMFYVKHDGNDIQKTHKCDSYTFISSEFSQILKV